MAEIYAAHALAGVRFRVDEVFRMLIEPSLENLQRCEVLLQSALDEFDGSRRLWSGARGDRQAMAEAFQIVCAIGRAGRLLETAEAFHKKWQLWLAMQSRGYTTRGAPAQLSGQGRISVQG